MLNAYAVMLPVIKAEEMQDHIQVIACGGGNLKKEEQHKIFRQLERQSKIIKDPLAEVKSKSINYAAFAAAGIPIVDMRKSKNGCTESKTPEV